MKIENWTPPRIPKIGVVFDFMKLRKNYLHTLNRIAILKLKNIFLVENGKVDTPKNPKNRPFLLKKWFHEIEINADFWDSWACPVFYFPPKICFIKSKKKTDFCDSWGVQVSIFHLSIFYYSSRLSQKEGRLVGSFGVFSFFFFPKKLLF